MTDSNPLSIMLWNQLLEKINIITKLSNDKFDKNKFNELCSCGHIPTIDAYIKAFEISYNSCYEAKFADEHYEQGVIRDKQIAAALNQLWENSNSYADTPENAGYISIEKWITLRNLVYYCFNNTYVTKFTKQLEEIIDLCLQCKTQ